ncbi:hypothetical protein [Idiomarina xiamenensis]|uniref:Uncharacterized protein n=1 Tax=Idiomarina xiamenensis 10-D-4 TaxID=740709 RepID=K2J981_9GAMM|nr:hypothetical protein [Idiomarina xiamenensis]EKE79716.1 hypothetical protein A10D4_12689 [Idiomarina xiamenensis 10-D-4]
MSNKSVEVVLSHPARINGEKHQVTGEPIAVDERIAKQLADAGALAQQKPDDDSDSDDGLAKQNKADLIDIAKQLGIDVPSNANKADIIALIEREKGE